MKAHWTRPGFAVISLLAIAGCSGGGGSNAPVQMDIVRASNGFGELLPHAVFQLDASTGNPTTQVISIKSTDDLINNVRGNNPVLPTPVFETTAILPGGAPGNQFLYVEFTAPLDITSVLSDLPGGASTGSLTGAVLVTAFNPASGEALPVKGRAFVNGQTFAGTPVAGDSHLPLQTWVYPDGTVNLEVDNNADGIPDGVGFPSTEAPFVGSDQLFSLNTLVFVVDSDDKLYTHETFPANREIRIQITTAVNSSAGRQLQRQGFVSTTVGPDTTSPEVLVTPPPSSSPVVTPGQGEKDVDPLTSILIEFSEPLQPFTLGPLPDGKPPGPSAAVTIQFGPPTQRVTVPFNVLPLSAYDLSRWQLTPAFNFPGEGPSNAECGIFNRIDVQVNSAQFADFAGNMNTNAASTFFETGEGPGLVNAPVAPEAIYVGRQLANSGVSIVDLNGFGAGTGNPTYDPTYTEFEEGWSNYPNNPNFKLQGSVIRPPLGPPTCTLNGGSAGVFTLTKDTSLNDLVTRSPVVLGVGDMAIGHALDGTFNNGPAPFGCQAGGGSLCSQTGQKNLMAMVTGPNTIGPPYLNNQVIVTNSGGENIISWAPSPNPPPMAFPPLCVAPFIGGQEVTSIFTVIGTPWLPSPPNVGLGLQNLLVPGDPFGNPNAGIPPSGMLSPEQNAWMVGPSLPAQNIAACQPYMFRQQIGHFLYLIDRGRREVVVFNSNDMRVIDRIPLPDPTSLAMGTNVDFLAVTNQAVNTVSFIDTKPSSATFHQVIKETVVGEAPRGIAWQPENEDILVCNEGSSELSILSAFSLEVRKTVGSQLEQPFEVAITGRQTNYGFNRGVYFAYILNRSGRVAIFESGPNGVNGWGYDDIIGTAPQTFQNPKAIQPDTINLSSAVWIAHEGPIDSETGEAGPEGIPALSNLFIESALFFQLPLNVTSLLIPQFRDMSLQVQVSIGAEQLTGVPVDIAFDNMRNYGGIINYSNVFTAGVPVPLNGRSLVRNVQNVVQNASEPKYLFAAIPNPLSGSSGAIDVIDIGGGFTRIDVNAFQPGTQSIQVTGAMFLADLWRQ